MNRAILLGALSMLVGCGDDGRAPVIQTEPSGGARATGGRSSKGGAAGAAGRAGSSERGGSGGRGGSAGSSGKTSNSSGGSSGTAGTSELAGMAGSTSQVAAPLVKITAPVAVSDPNSDDVLKASIGNQGIDVTCSVKPENDASPVNVDKVTIELVQGATVVAGTVTGSASEYHATFLPTAFATGAIKLRCSAPAIEHEGAVGSDEVSTFVDRGPVVTIAEPKDTSAHSSGGLLHIAANIEVKPVDPADTRAALANIDVTVDERSMFVPPPNPPDLSGLVVLDKKLNDPAIFGNTPPFGTVALKVIATNKRGTTVTETIFIFVDQAPPVITVKAPVGNQVVKETGQVSFGITDADSDIDLTTLRLRIGSSAASQQSPIFRYSATDTNWSCLPVAASRKSYTCTFRYTKNDVKNFISQALVFVDVSDIAGNDTATPASPATGNIYLNIDRVPPIVHLDPPTIRYVRKESQTKIICSDVFDPVGWGAVDDLQKIGISNLFRAFVWDTAQHPPATLTVAAQTDQSSVYVYIQHDPTVPLLKHQFIDRNGDNVDDDNYCNYVNSSPAAPALVPDAVLLSPITPFLVNATPAETGSDWGVSPEPPENTCVSGTTTTIPAPQCGSPVDLPFVISHGASRTIPAVYAKSPSNSPSNGCTGTTYQFRTDAAYGWKCAAAVAVDQAGGNDGTSGNMGVSPPLRLCYQSDPSGPLSCTLPAPSCTDGCTPYDAFVDVPPIPFVGPLSRIIEQAPTQ